MSRRRLSLEAISRQKVLPLDVPRFDSKAANDVHFHDVASKKASVVPRSIESLIEEIQDEDRQRLLEPTSLPKVLRGHRRRPRPQTAIISRAAQAAYERRMAHESNDELDRVALARFMGAHRKKLDRLVKKLRG